MTDRIRAAALLDVLRVGAEGDKTAHACTESACFAACFAASNRGPMSLVDLVKRVTSGTDARETQRAASEGMQLARFPLTSLAWAWADTPETGQTVEPGHLDRRLGRAPHERGTHPWECAGRTAMGVCLGWTMRPKRPVGTLVLSGPTGCGKGVAAAYLAIRQGGRWIQAARIGELAIGEDGAKALDRLAHEPFLILDEVGRETNIGKSSARMVDLLTRRGDSGLTTLLLTNMHRKHTDPSMSFDARYGWHLIDRIESGAGGWFDLRRASMRSDVPPSLTRIRSLAEIAELVPRVNAAASAVGSSDGELDTNRLAHIMGVTSEEIDTAIQQRKDMHAKIFADAEDLEGGIAATLGKILARTTGESQ